MQFDFITFLILFNYLTLPIYSIVCMHAFFLCRCICAVVLLCISLYLTHWDSTYARILPHACFYLPVFHFHVMVLYLYCPHPYYHHVVQRHLTGLPSLPLPAYFAYTGQHFPFPLLDTTIPTVYYYLCSSLIIPLGS